jgi:hypothetical protein
MYWFRNGGAVDAFCGLPSLEPFPSVRRFFNVLNFLVPDCLGDWKDFSANFAKPLDKLTDPLATQREIDVGTERVKQYNTLVGPFLLRRKKDLIADQLTKKRDQVRGCARVYTLVCVLHLGIAEWQYEDGQSASSTPFQTTEFWTWHCSYIGTPLLSCSRVLLFLSCTHPSTGCFLPTNQTSA